MGQTKAEVNTDVAKNIELDRVYALNPMTPAVRQRISEDINDLTKAKSEAPDVEPDIHPPVPHDDVTATPT